MSVRTVARKRDLTETAPQHPYNRNFPLPYATGRLGSRCQATTCTLAMRRPSLKISARAVVVAGPAERR